MTIKIWKDSEANVTNAAILKELQFLTDAGLAMRMAAVPGRHCDHRTDQTVWVHGLDSPYYRGEVRCRVEPNFSRD